MYQQQYKLATTQQNIRSNPPVYYSTFHTAIWVVLIALASLTSLNSRADSYNPKGFQQQLINTNPNASSLQQAMLNEMLPSNLHSSVIVTRAEEDEELAFNYLWMQQYEEGYEVSEGGSAAGKILRMGLKALYRTHYGNSSNASNNDSDEIIDQKLAKFDYRLRVSKDNVKLGIKYEF